MEWYQVDGMGNIVPSQRMLQKGGWGWGNKIVLAKVFPASLYR